MAYGNYMPNNYQQGFGGYGNQYFTQPMQPMQGQMPQMQQPVQMQQPQYKPAGIQGKSVDNIEVVKATDIPLDGSISYFPITDGSAIVTKQLMMDGTSKTIIYKPTEEPTEIAEKPKYLTVEEFNNKVKEISSSDLKDDIKAIKRQIKDIIEDIKEINEDIKK